MRAKRFNAHHISIPYLFYGFLCIWLISCSKNENIDTLFTLIDGEDSGVVFKNIINENEEFNVLEYGYLYNGGGVALGDVNNDGLVDIYFTGNLVGSHLYLNQGDFKFKEIAKSAGVFAEGNWNTGTTMVDINADGYLDIYVCRSASSNPKKRKNLLFINNKDLTFTEQAEKYGLADSGYTTQATFFDYDLDGDLDAYILNHSVPQYAGFGKITATLKNKSNPNYGDKLYRNDDGIFTNVSQEVGLTSNVLGFGLGVSISDLNGDAWPDIYVSNDYNEQDYLYINNGNGTFTDQLEKFIGHTSLFSMGADIADINNDGYFDIYTLDMLPESNYRQKMAVGSDNYNKYNLLVDSGFYHQSMRNMLQLNHKGSFFSEIGQYSGISNSDWSWSALIADYDNDGYNDIYVSNGYKRDYTNMDFINYAVQEKLKENKSGEKIVVTEMLKKMPSSVLSNYAFKNIDGIRFKKVQDTWGLKENSLSNGAAYADLDNDGDLDLVVNNIDTEAFIYRNNSETISTNKYLKLKLTGSKKNIYGIGSKAIITLRNGTVLTKELYTTRGFQSSVEPQLHFGLGQDEAIKNLTIQWPDNSLQTFTDIKVDTTYIIKQSEAMPARKENTATPTTYFVKSQSDIPFKHNENTFNDFKYQPLLIHKLSSQGPKLTTADVNNDQLQDVFISGAKGQSSQWLWQDKKGGFASLSDQTFKIHAQSEDIDHIVFDADNDGDLDLYVVSGGVQIGNDSLLLQDRMYFNNGSGQFTYKSGALPRMISSGSCVATVDYDKDGDLDLFVGGRTTPMVYPKTPTSYILENQGDGNFTNATDTVGPSITNLGMVTDAIWVDINNDTWSDLLIVGEYMPIQLFLNQKGKLVNASESFGLIDTEGWWNTITSGDFDNDGDTDFVLGNFGLNSQLHASPEHPILLYADDFDSNGFIDPLLFSYQNQAYYPELPKDDVLGQLNHLKNKFTNYDSYAKATLNDILSPEQIANANVLKAKRLESIYLENVDGTTFKINELPFQAQMSPIYSMQVTDLNRDGNLDIITAGNFNGARVKYGKYDANHGAAFLGDGSGNFSFIGHDQTGIILKGDIRDITLTKDQSGKEILWFAKNNDSIAAYELVQEGRE